jgi:hypothetical protein
MLLQLNLLFHYLILQVYEVILANVLMLMLMYQ